MRCFKRFIDRLTSVTKRKREEIKKGVDDLSYIGNSTLNSPDRTKLYVYRVAPFWFYRTARIIP